MPKLPAISGRQLLRALQRAGFTVVRQKGSHVSLQKDELRTVVPMHSELAKGTLSGILRQCNLTKDELENLLK